MPRIVLTLLGDLLQWLALGMRSHTRLAAENLFLRKQLAFYAERRIKPRRLDDGHAAHAGRPRPIHRVARPPPQGKLCVVAQPLDMLSISVGLLYDNSLRSITETMSAAGGT
jgi:hypothetical protein